MKTTKYQQADTVQEVVNLLQSALAARRKGEEEKATRTDAMREGMVYLCQILWGEGVADRIERDAASESDRRSKAQANMRVEDAMFASARPLHYRPSGGGVSPREAEETLERLRITESDSLLGEG